MNPAEPVTNIFMVFGLFTGLTIFGFRLYVQKSTFYILRYRRPKFRKTDCDFSSFESYLPIAAYSNPSAITSSLL